MNVVKLDSVTLSERFNVKIDAHGVKVNDATGELIVAVDGVTSSNGTSKTRYLYGKVKLVFI